MQRIEKMKEKGSGAQGRIRTTDTGIFSHVLYQLSYLGTVGFLQEAPWAYRQSGGACPALWRPRSQLRPGPHGTGS